MPQSFESTLQHVELGQTHKPREKMSFRITKLPAGWYLCPACFLGLLFSRSPLVLITVTESFRISLSQWWNFPEKTELPQPRAVRGGMVTPGDSVSEVIDWSCLVQVVFPISKLVDFHVNGGISLPQRMACYSLCREEAPLGAKNVVSGIRPRTQFGGLPQWLGSKEFACNAGNAEDTGLIPGSGISPGEGQATHSSILAWTEKPGGLQLKRLSMHACNKFGPTMYSCVVLNKSLTYWNCFSHL